MENSDIRTLAEYNSENEAAVVKALLDVAGIRSQIINDLLLGVITTTDGHVRLVVNENDYERAKEVLDANFDRRNFCSVPKK